MKFLVAVDGSKSSLSAARYAAKLASAVRGHNRVTLLSVHDDSALKLFKSYVPTGVIGDFLREMSEKDLAPSRKALDKAGVAQDMAIRFGDITTQILEEIQSSGCDMVVMGSKGRGALKNLLVGSVAHKVAASASVPVLLVR
jgi:nucleotide-binding universal stress UspA family protein